MPRMDGFALYEQIKKIDSKIKVFFVTASGVNYEVLRKLYSVDRHDLNDDDIAAILETVEKQEEKRDALLESQ